MSAAETAPDEPLRAAVAPSPAGNPPGRPDRRGRAPRTARATRPHEA